MLKVGGNDKMECVGMGVDENGGYVSVRGNDKKKNVHGRE